MTDVFIVGAARTPIGKFMGALSQVAAPKLGAVAAAAAVERAGMDPPAVDDVIIGIENMSAAPHLFVGARQGVRLGSAELKDAIIHDGLWCPFEDQHMGHAAEAIAEKRGVARGEMDEYSLRSHQKAVAAIKGGRRPVGCDAAPRPPATRAEARYGRPLPRRRRRRSR